ncbi:TonB-dependent receptor [Xanthovirga aplysinae]|uniref:TonB-dependent receptor n=1 Tax=Xanthovirga aplysinae TaxID=2529853 RepID=UPI0012BC7CEB|nr:TonB-dependent receptor [Xanthovirga aplysinae]
MKKILLTGALCLCALFSWAQTETVRGRVIDPETGEGLYGANAVIQGTTIGAMTDLDGTFRIENVQEGAQTLVISFIGFEDVQKDIQVNAGQVLDLGDISLETSSTILEGIEVLADVAIDRKTPVAVSTVKPEFIEEKLGTQEFPEILKATPGVYATKQGGAFGDSRINLRGFSSENIAVMINGVPVNDMEWGGVYWSNWAGLSDVTRSMQVQRGLGASKIAVPSVGGSINILTKTTDMKKGGSVYAGIGNDGYRKEAITLSTGLMDNGYAITFSGSHTYGDGYIQGTDFDAWSYFINVSKKINRQHELSFTAFGAPQWHNQRSSYDKQTIEDWKTFKEGFRYNAAFGYDDNGQPYVSGKNYYHKPQISLNHYWTINNKTSINTSAYASIASGGGYSAQGAEGSRLFGSSDDRTPSGALDYGAIIRDNAANEDGSQAIMASSNNNHQWYGILSNLNTELSDNFTFSGGVDLRYYIGEHNRTIEDLLGGSYYNDAYSRINSDYLNPNEKLGVGDIISRNYNGYVLWSGAFGQVEYSKDNLSAFLSGAISNTRYQRREFFYQDDVWSDKLNFLGYSAKTGANYNISDHHNVFANIGYFSRAPFFSSIFIQKDYGNSYNPDAVNEKVFSFELGYGFRNSWLSANVNAYNTRWKDKSTNGAILSDDRVLLGYYNATGVDALHKGAELELKANPTTKLTLTGMISLGDWKWLNDVTALATDLQGLPIDRKGRTPADENYEGQYEVEINASGTHVTDAAQTTAALGANYQLFPALKVGLDYFYFANLYARQDVNYMDNEDSWEVPSAGVLDANLKYNFKIAKLKSTLYAKVNNVLNTEYISDADNGRKNNMETATVFYGFGRTWSMGLKVDF